MNISFMLLVAPNVCLTILSPLCCLSFYITFRLLVYPPSSEKAFLIYASAGASFLCGVALLAVIANYNILNTLSIYTLLLRAVCMVIGLVLNDTVVIMRMRTLSDKMTLLVILTCCFSIIKHIGGVMMIVTLCLRIASGDTNGLSLPVQRLILLTGEMATGVCFVIFWFRLFQQHSASNSKMNEGLVFFVKFVKINILISSMIVIVLWGICIYTDWTYNVVFDYFMMPTYFFVLCPSSILIIAKDYQVKMSKETEKAMCKTGICVPVEF